MVSPLLLRLLKCTPADFQFLSYPVFVVLVNAFPRNKQTVGTTIAAIALPLEVRARSGSLSVPSPAAPSVPLLDFQVAPNLFTDLF